MPIFLKGEKKMNNVSGRKLKNLVCISFRSLLLYMFLMVNTGFVFAAGVAIDNIRFSTTEGVERGEFLPGEQGLAHVDYTLDSESDKNVVVSGRISGPKEPRGKWRTFPERQKNLKQPGSNRETLSFTVNPNAIPGSEATVNINARSGISINRDQTTFSVVDEIPTPVPGASSTPIDTPTSTPIGTPTATSTPLITPIPTPISDPKPPVLGSIGDKSVNVGDTLTLNISATDPNNDQLTFSVSPIPLPDNTTFKATTGVFTFSPAADQEGDLTLTFTVSDGGLTDFETITIKVIGALADGDTALKGQILDANDAEADITTPIVGATVTNTETGLSTTTDSNGNFILGGLTAGENHFDYDGDTVSGPNGSTYGAFRGMQELIANVTNVISRPVYLMRLELEGEVQVDPDSETTVENGRIGVKIEIPPQTVLDDNGSLFTGMISISEVPFEFTPASLPEALQLGLVITIQPTGLTFDQPVPITFPNIDNLIAGSEVDIWSLDHKTGEFFISATGEVSSDGAEINTISGGISAASWHGPSPGSTTGETDDSKCKCKKKDCKRKTGSETSVASGNHTIDHTLVSYRALGQSVALRFVYNSELADPRPIVSSNVTNSSGTTVPVKLSSSLTVAGVDQGVDIYTDTSALTQGTDDTIIQVLQFDANEFETGIYDYRMKHTSHYELSVISSFSSDFVIVNNEKSSPFGAGWTLDGLQRLRVVDDVDALLTEGDGSALSFSPLFRGSGDFSGATSFDIARNSDEQDIVSADFNGDGILDIAVVSKGSSSFGGGPGLVSILPGDENGGFMDLINIETPIGISGMAVDDLNGDNVLDIALTNSNDDNVSILIGKGNGTFSEPTSFEVGDSPQAIAIDDFNGDGNSDLAVMNRSSDNVSVLIGDGNGEFSSPTDFQAGDSPASHVTGDFNGDGILDLAVANGNSSDVSILFGDGTGSFSSVPTNFSVSDDPLDIAATDFNNDGILDLITVNLSLIDNSKGSILIGDGTGSFSLTNFFPSSSPKAVAVADFDGDSNNDAVVTNEDSVTILLGDGAGTFSDQFTFTAGVSPFKTTIGDFGTDGVPDLAVANFRNSTVSLLTGDGTGVFIDTPGFFASGQSSFALAADDFNKDGESDLAVLTRSGVEILPGDGNGAFPSSAQFSTGGLDPRSFTVDDFNNDGNLDIAAANSSSDNLGILFGNGDGTFLTAATVSVDGAPTPIVSKDFNNDGNIDIAVVNTSSSNVSILLNDGTGTFTETRFEVGDNSTSIAVSDFNMDGEYDLALTDDISSVSQVDIVSIYFGDGSGAFPDSTDFELGADTNPLAVKFGNVDGDGFVDFVVLNGPAKAPNSLPLVNNVQVFLGDGSGSASSPISFTTGKTPISMALDDFDEDGVLDIAIGNQSSSDITIFIGQGNGTFEENETFAIGGSLSEGSLSNEMVVQDFDGNGVLDIVAADSDSPVGIHILLGAPAEQTGFESPSGDFSKIAQNEDGSFTRTMKDGTTINFDTNGFQASIVDRNGNTTTYNYDVNDNLTSITDPTGLVTTLAYSDDKLSSVKDPAGRTTSFSVDSEGNIISITDPDGSSRIFDYDSSNLLIGQTSKRDFITTYSYDSFGKMTLSRLADGSTNQVTAGNTSGLADPFSDEGTEENPVPALRPEDVISIFVDSNGNQTIFETNRFGASNMTTDPLGRTTLIVRDDNSNPTQFEEPNGAISTMSYDDRGNLLTLKEAVGDNLERQTSFAYEPDFNQITRITDPAGNSTTFEYDDNGNLINTTDSLGNMNRFTYNTKGLVLTSADANGNTATFSYDANGNLTTATDALGNITSFDRDNAGNIISFTEGVDTLEERTNSFTYDDLNRILTIVDGTGATTTLSYDSAGNVEKAENPTGEITTFAYDERNRVVTIDNPISGITQLEYDENSNLVSSTDSLGNATTNEYDDDDQLIKSINALSGESTLGYDTQGNVISFKDALGQTTTFTYDLLDRQIKQTNPLGLTESFTYDSRDNIVTGTDKKGQVITNRYDELSRLTESKTSDNASSYTYDAVGNLVTIQDNDSSISLTYDEINRVLTSEVIDVGIQPGVTLTNSYDSLSNRIQLTDTSGGTTQFSYDSTDRLIKLVTPAGDTINLSNDLAGRLTQIAFPNSVISDLNYDVNGRLENLTHKDGGGADLAGFGYTYNEVGNILSIAEQITTRQFSYDALQRLISGGTTDSPETYSYDVLGNRDTSHLSSNHKYDSANRLLEDDDFTYDYDDNGNLSTKNAKNGDGTTTYTWDVQNQLIQIDFPDSTNASYRYDGLGRRIEKNVNGAIIRYVYDNFDILFELDGTNTIMAHYSHGDSIDQPLNMERNGQSFFYQVDNLGSVRKLTDASGVVVNSLDYDSYGRLENSVEAVDNPFAYTGREKDAESGLYYYRSRYYDPHVGRFLSQDPIEFSGGDANIYRYVRNDPINRFDPLGLFPVNTEDVGKALAIPVGFVGAAGGLEAALTTVGLTTIEATAAVAATDIVVVEGSLSAGGSFLLAGGSEATVATFGIATAKVLLPVVAAAGIGVLLGDKINKRLSPSTKKAIQNIFVDLKKTERESELGGRGPGLNAISEVQINQLKALSKLRALLMSLNKKGGNCTADIKRLKILIKKMRQRIGKL